MKKHLFSVIVLAAIVAVTGFASSARAVDLSGWAWSPNIGWLSFNSANSGAGSGAAYKVSIATSTGSPTVASFGGYAWSSNIGWLSFQPSDVTGCPATGGGDDINGCVPSVNLLTGKVAGWARALAGTSTNTAITGGWDGWLHLAGTNHSSPDSSGYQGTSTGGITLSTSTGAFSGLAWGSTNIGWLSFNAGSPVASVPPVTVEGDCHALGTCPAAPSCSISANPSIITSGGSSSLTWASHAYNSCTVTGPTGTTLSSALSGSQTVSPASGSNNYGISCTGATEAPTTCNGLASVTVAAVPSNTVAMWVENSSNTADQSITSIQMKQGGSAKVDYAWNVPEGYTCRGTILMVPAGVSQSTGVFGSWTTGTLNSDGSDLVLAGTQNFTFSNLTTKGTYKFRIRCDAPIELPAAAYSSIAQSDESLLSNPVTITVVSSSVEEI